MPSHSRVDVHHHYQPPKFRDVTAGVDVKEWKMPHWTLESSEAAMEKYDIATSILSLTSPGPDVAGPASAASIARDANESGASIRDAQPKKFGFFAAIPSPDYKLQAALDEIAHAFDVLHADGITLFTSYGGKYLGHPDFAPLWTELNRRKAVVYTHPTSPSKSSSYNVDPSSETAKANPTDPLFALPPLLDFAFETTRTAFDLIITRTLQHNPDVKVILSHAGGTLPFVWARPAVLMPSIGKLDMGVDEFRDQARRFYFDTALSGIPEVIEYLVKFAAPKHILFGSDFPYASGEVVKNFTDGLDSTSLDEETRKDIDRGTAMVLFPRLAE